LEECDRKGIINIVYIVFPLIYHANLRKKLDLLLFFLLLMIRRARLTK
jgi:hypothetical protein